MNIYTKKNNFLWKKISMGIFALIILIGFLNIFQAQIKNYVYLVNYPISKFFWLAGDGTHNFIASFLESKELKKETDNLREENQNLLSQIYYLQKEIKTNQSIEKILQNTQKDNFKMVLSEIIGLDSMGDFILLNKGFDDGISENMPVISEQKVLYGKVFEVYKNFSKIMLISNKSSILNAKIQSENSGQTSIDGVIRGRGNLSIYLDLISSEAEISNEDILLTSGLEGSFPKNLLVGKITSKDKNDLKPFQTASVSPFFDIKNTDNLFIITNYKIEK